MRTDLIERLLRGLYSTALYLLVPLTVYHLIWRGFRQPAYFQRWNERYARYYD
ncbi:MAG TPA: 3-deoxy-D-manno-octulosonic acid transferase, partial [Lysobacter sp.]|nr:3-deoxy-D-manno-octulosonic acid transferase [Lysobacter sp.]